MATLVETQVRVVVELVRDGADQKVYITGHSRDVNGNWLRAGDKFDVTPFLTPTQVNAGLTMLDAAEAYYKNLWSIA